jgi:hypothetical protein
MPGKFPGRSGQPPPRGSPSTNHFHYSDLSDPADGLDVEFESFNGAASDAFSEAFSAVFSDDLSAAFSAALSSLAALEREALPDGDRLSVE